MARPQRAQVPATRKNGERSAAPAPAAGSVAAEQIAARAYELWLESGKPDGQHEEHWFQAERELRGAAS